MRKSLVSVVMAVYNGQDFVESAIQSILDQTYKNFELIIVDDGSTDDSAAIIKAIKDKRIHYIYEKNRKLPGALNNGIAHAKGEFIARMDADDLSYPDRLEKQANFLLKNNDVALVGANFDIIDLDGQLIGRSYHLDRPSDIKLEFLLRNPFGHGTIMVRRHALELIGSYDAQHPIEDYELWWRLAQKFKLANLPDFLYAWRVSPAGMSHGDTDRRQKPIADLMDRVRRESTLTGMTRAEIKNGLSHYTALGPQFVEQYSYMLAAFCLAEFKRGHILFATLLLAKLLTFKKMPRAILGFVKDPFSHNYNLKLVSK